MRLAAFITLLLAFAAPSRAGEQAWKQNDLIPRRVLFGNPERSAPYISPDGTKILYTAPVDGVMNLWVAPIGNLEAARPLTHERQRPIMKFEWARNDSHLLYLQDTGGDENFHVFAVDLKTAVTTDLTPHNNIRAEILASSDERPGEIVVALNNRDKRWHDAWLINVVNGKMELLQKNDGFASFVIDNRLAVRFGLKTTSGSAQNYFRLHAGQWTPFTSIAGDDALTSEPLFFTADNNSFYMIDSRDRNTSALTLVDAATSKSVTLAQSKYADIQFVIKDPRTHEVVAVGSEYDRMDWQGLTGDARKDIKFLNQQIPGFWFPLSQSRDSSAWTIWIDNPGEPIKFALYERSPRKLTPLYTARPNLVGAPLPVTHPQLIKSRDGLNLVSYLTLPKSSDDNSDGVPDQPLPLVLMVHGGPWMRDSIAYNPYAAWLANRGYAVLAVNFRGSTGFGKDFVNAGDKEWGGKMHDDLIDAVNWAIASKIALRNKIAIYGVNYGGYATLVGLTSTPKTFACGIDVVGHSNLATMLANIPPYWESFIETFKRRVGDPSTKEGLALLKQRSPLFRAREIERPLLIGHGANDPRVKQSEALQIVKTMRQKRLPATYVLYADEGHGFARPQNRLSFNAISEQFLAQCLGGRAEPIGQDFAGSSVSVPSGKEHIKGLTKALAAP